MLLPGFGPPVKLPARPAALASVIARGPPLGRTPKPGVGDSRADRGFVAAENDSRLPVVRNELLVSLRELRRLCIDCRDPARELLDRLELRNDRRVTDAAADPPPMSWLSGEKTCGLADNPTSATCC